MDFLVDGLDLSKAKVNVGRGEEAHKFVTVPVADVHAIVGIF